MLRLAFVLAIFPTAVLCAVFGKDEADTNFQNPCTFENIDKDMMHHPYLFNDTKYVQCDYQGNAYVMPCPGGTVWSQDVQTCVWSRKTRLTTTAPDVTDSQGPDPDRPSGNGTAAETSAARRDVNPCTTQALSLGKLYHPHPQDKFKFVQCDTSGNAWVRPCAPGTEWSDYDTSCIQEVLADSTTRRPN